jgi:hypothetical protein
MRPLLPVALVASVGIALAVALANPQPSVGARASGPLVVGAITYTAQSARPLDEFGDAAVIRALPASERRATRGRVLYGVFVTLANDGTRTRPTSRRFALIGVDYHSFSPIPLRPDSAFAYRARDLAGGRVLPQPGSPPAQDYAEQGYPLVFSIPRASARDGALTLRVFDPTGATPPEGTVVQSA